MLSKSPWQPRDIEWAVWQAAQLNTFYERSGVTSQSGPATAELLLNAEQSYCDLAGISLDESWPARERMMNDSKRLTARVVSIFRRGGSDRGSATGLG